MLLHGVAGPVELRFPHAFAVHWCSCGSPDAASVVDEVELLLSTVAPHPWRPGRVQRPRSPPTPRFLSNRAYNTIRYWTGLLHAARLPGRGPCVWRSLRGEGGVPAPRMRTAVRRPQLLQLPGCAPWSVTVAHVRAMARPSARPGAPLRAQVHALARLRAPRCASWRAMARSSARRGVQWRAQVRALARLGAPRCAPWRRELPSLAMSVAASVAAS